MLKWKAFYGLDNVSYFLNLRILNIKVIKMKQEWNTLHYLRVFKFKIGETSLRQYTKDTGKSYLKEDLPLGTL